VNRRRIDKEFGPNRQLNRLQIGLRRGPLEIRHEKPQNALR
jgi:hypothetical protein